MLLRVWTGVSFGLAAESLFLTSCCALMPFSGVCVVEAETCWDEPDLKQCQSLPCVVSSECQKHESLCAQPEQRAN